MERKNERTKKNEKVGSAVRALTRASRHCRVLHRVTEEGAPIGTHSGSFHADETLACGMLKLLPTFRDSDIVRSRNPETLRKCAIVVDVGGSILMTHGAMIIISEVSLKKIEN